MAEHEGKAKTTGSLPSFTEPRAPADGTGDNDLDAIIKQIASELKKPSKSLPEVEELSVADRLSFAFAGAFDQKFFEKNIAPKLQARDPEFRALAQADLDEEAQTRRLNILSKLAQLLETRERSKVRASQEARAVDTATRAEAGEGRAVVRADQQAQAVADTQADRTRAEAGRSDALELQVDEAESLLSTIGGTDVEGVQIPGILEALPKGAPTLGIRKDLENKFLLMEGIVDRIDSGEPIDEAAATSKLSEIVNDTQKVITAANVIINKGGLKTIEKKDREELTSSLSGARLVSAVLSEFKRRGFPGGLTTGTFNFAITDNQIQFRAILDAARLIARKEIFGSALTAIEKVDSFALFPEFGIRDVKIIAGLEAIRGRMVNAYITRVKLLTRLGFDTAPLGSLAAEEGFLITDDIFRLTDRFEQPLTQESIDAGWGSAEGLLPADTGGN